MFVWDFSFVLGSNLLRMVISVAAGIIIARSLGPEGKGIYVVAFLLPRLVATFGDLGLRQSLIYRIGRKHLSLEQAMGTTLIIDAVLSVGLMALALTLAIIFSTTLVRGVAFYLIILTTMSIPLRLLSGHLRNMLRAVGRIRAYSMFSLSESVAQLAAFAILVSLSSLTISRVIMVQLGLRLTLMLVCLGAAAQGLRGRLQPELKAMRGLLSFGLRSHVAYVFVALERRFDVLLLNAFLFPAQVGLYAVGVSAAQIVLYVTDAMGTVLYPRISSSSPEQVRQFLPRISRLSILLSALVGIGLVMVGKPLISLLYGRDFDASYMAMVILLPGIVTTTVFRVSGSYLQGMGRPGVVSAITILSFAVNLGANLILIPRRGINGAALASTISYSLGACLVLIVFSRDSRLGVRELLVPRWSDLMELVNLAAQRANQRKIMVPGWGPDRTSNE